MVSDIQLIQGDGIAMLKAMPAGSVDMIMTDPPYGHNNNNGDLIHRWEIALGRSSGEAVARPIVNDSYDEANELFISLVVEASRVLAPGGCCCCCGGGGGGPDPMFARWALEMDKHLTFKQMVVWDKGKIGMGWHYRRSYEVVLVAHRGAKSNWYDKTKKVENIIRDIEKIIPKKTDHPTPKPVKLMKFFIEKHTKPGDLVVDPFMGAGTTAIACKRLGRRFLGAEIDPQFFSMASERLK